MCGAERCVSQCVRDAGTCVVFCVFLNAGVLVDYYGGIDSARLVNYSSGRGGLVCFQASMKSLLIFHRTWCPDGMLSNGPSPRGHKGRLQGNLGAALPLFQPLPESKVLPCYGINVP